MARYCGECGAELTGARFCTECGHGIDPAPATVAGEVQAAEPATAAAATATRTSSAGRTAIVVGAVAAVVAVLLISVIVIQNQARLNADEATQMRAVAAEAEQEAAEAKAQRQRIRHKATTRALTEALAADQPKYVAPAPNAPVYTGSVAGDWAGTMSDGKYEFYLTIDEQDGRLSGSMYQRSNKDGDDGYEDVEGYRDGNTLYLNGVRWNDAPDDWSLDQMVLQLSTDGQSFSGRYDCDTCAATSPISGSRWYD